MKGKEKTDWRAGGKKCHWHP